MREAEATAEGAEAPLARGAGPAGLGFVATVSFLASRAAPTGGFLIALAGGTAMARAGQRFGARCGYGASIAAMLESVAIMGPTRFGVPFTQAITAPMLGRLEARRVRPALQVLACGAIRLLQNALGTAFFIWVILGLDAYAGSYDALLGGVLPDGETAALVATAVALLAWAAFASTLQVIVYRRGLRRWPREREEGQGDAGPAAPAASPEEGGGAAELPPAASLDGDAAAAAEVEPARRFDPRATSLATAIAFGLLVASTEWPLLAAVAAWLAVAAATSRGDAGVVPTGLVLTAVVAGGTLAFGLVGGLGADLALRRGARAGLLVLVATWLRAAAGSEGLREVARRTLRRARRLPSVPEAAAVLDRLGSDRRLVASGRELLDALGPTRKSLLPLADAVLGWIAGQAGRFRPIEPAAPLRLRLRGVDALILAGAALPLIAALAA